MYKAVEIFDKQLRILDQTKLPLEETYIITSDYERIAQSIEKLEVRGAPAIGITAAYAVALGMRNRHGENYKEHFNTVIERLARTRPTAVNLFGALERMRAKFNSLSNYKNTFSELLDEARAIDREDGEMCDEIAENGQRIFVKKSRVLTHCNTGRLVTGGGGTALYIIERAFESGMVDFVHADETRPLLQGSRLTAYELDKLGIPFAINTDSTAAHLMKESMVDLVITGADRIAANGDSANKIGTYNLAVNCKHHDIPFYIAAPSSTIDSKCGSGKDIKIEFRSADEVNSIRGVLVTKQSYPVISPAFDVTPAELITGIITDKDYFQYPYSF